MRLRHPPRAPLRQLVLTLPFELCARPAFDGQLCGEVCLTFVDYVMDFYHLCLAALGMPGGKSGAVTAVRRVSSDLRLNLHFHTLALEGVFAEGADGEFAFHQLPALTNADVADLLQIARARIWRLLGRRGVIEDDEVTADRELSDREPALAQLVGPGVAGSPPAGPALRRQDPIHLRARGELDLRGLCGAEHGFSLHAATTAGAGDRAGKEALCRYILRPPLAQDRVTLVADDLVRLTLKRPFSDGTVALDPDPLSLLVRLAMSVPPPRFNSVRYAGVLAARSSWRARVMPPPPADEHDSDGGGGPPPTKSPPTKSPPPTAAGISRGASS